MESQEISDELLNFKKKLKSWVFKSLNKFIIFAFKRKNQVLSPFFLYYQF